MTRAELVQPACVLPCPFCGHAPRVVDLGGWEVLCTCGASLCLVNDSDRDAVVEAWNIRSLAADPRIAEYRELLLDAEQGLRVLKTMLRIEHFPGGAATAEQLIERIRAALKVE